MKIVEIRKAVWFSSSRPALQTAHASARRGAPTRIETTPNATTPAIAARTLDFTPAPAVTGRPASR